MLKPRPELKLDARHAGFPYQVDAVEAIKKLPYAAVFHEQGLGKTKIGIDVGLEWLRANEVDSVLIVTKRSLIRNWTDEMRSHTFVSPRILDQRKPSNFFALNSPARFYLTHYEVIKSEERRLALFLKTRRVAVLLDEAQKIKNPEADLTKAMHRLAPSFARKVLLTGTPVANRPYDLWSQIFFLDGGRALGDDFAAFQSMLDLSNDLWSDAVKRASFEGLLGKVFDKIRAFTVRETKATAGIQLPEKHIANVPVALTTRQLDLYRRYQLDVKAEVMRDGQLVRDDAEDILKRLLRLVQVASNPKLVDQSYDEEPAKLPALKSLIEKALAEGSKAIVWTSFIDNAEWLSKAMSRFGNVVVHGQRSMDERNRAIERFKTDPDVKVLIATPGAAKEGLTLTVANHAIFYDRSFSLDDYLQAQDRIHRISQTATCYIWNIVAGDTVDEWVEALLTAKRLAAQLAQSDISLEEYRRDADYDFGKMIKEILGVENDDG